MGLSALCVKVTTLDGCNPLASFACWGGRGSGIQETPAGLFRTQTKEVPMSKKHNYPPELVARVAQAIYESDADVWALVAAIRWVGAHS